MAQAQARGPAGIAAGEFVGFGTHGTIEEVELGGQDAAWVNGNALAWEQASIRYGVGGLGLDLETARRIAETLTEWSPLFSCT